FLLTGIYLKNGLTQPLIGLLLSLNSPLFLMTELGRSYDFLFPFTHLFLQTPNLLRPFRA
ncbi:MAG: hypothetical protein M0P61_10075, partial [Ignavibacteriaceae bacterium]|nr:hypothetical protein [Ignavibacteriaceae bacterium]